MKIALITTGGTIVSKKADGTGLASPEMDGRALLKGIEAFGDIGDIEVIDALNVSSPLIGPEDWLMLHQKVSASLARDDIVGAVITHGTATMEETAWFLDLTLSTRKPVVMTGAQRNASEPDSDGPRNLFNALDVCEAARGLELGVVVALNDSVHAAREVTKSQTLNVETFNSGAWGSLGQVRPNRVVFHRRPLRRLHVPLRPGPLPSVLIVPMYAGATRELVDAAVACGAKGIVIEAIASGHVNKAMQDGIFSALDAHVPVVVATRIPSGGTRAGYSFEGSSHHLASRGAVLSEDLSPWKARILLQLALQNGWGSAAELRGLFAQDRTPAAESRSAAA